MNIKIGDKIKVKTYEYINISIDYDDIGTVIELRANPNTDKNIGIQFDNDKVQGHTCGFISKTNTCWYMSASQIEVIRDNVIIFKKKEKKEKAKVFNIGDLIRHEDGNEYIVMGVKVAKNSKRRIYTISDVAHFNRTKVTIVVDNYTLVTPRNTTGSWFVALLTEKAETFIQIEKRFDSKDGATFYGDILTCGDNNYRYNNSKIIWFDTFRMNTTGEKSLYLLEHIKEG